MGDNLLSWSSRRQNVVSHSIVEAEYRRVRNAVAGTCWLRNLQLGELHILPSKDTLVVVQHQRYLYDNEPGLTPTNQS